MPSADFELQALAGGPATGATTTRFSGRNFRATCAADPDRTLVVLEGELDRSATAVFEPALASARAHGRAIDIDCVGLTFIDATGARRLAIALHDDPAIQLFGVPRQMQRVLALVGVRPNPIRHHGHPIVIATCAPADARHATRICTVFDAANQRGCAYSLSVVVLTSPPQARPAVRQRAVIVPPIDRWMGLSETDLLVSHLGRLTRNTEKVIGVGTGVFLLAAAGLLNDRDVVVDSARARYLSESAPRARVHCGVAALCDDDVITVAHSSGIESVCSALIDADYAVP